MSADDTHEAAIELQSQICALVAEFESRTQMRVETIVPARGYFPTDPGTPKKLWGVHITISPFRHDQY